jgi:tetratricopeptide (TPR) repeat protein
MKQPRLITALAVLAAVAAVGQPALAQGSYYLPPKLVKQGKTTTPITGRGTVIVKVLVNPDATFKVQGVIKSTNHGDDAAALDIARTSKYKPATRSGKNVLAFYDFSLKFTATSVTSGDDQPTASGGLSSYDRMIRVGNYSGARSGLTQYLAAHPGDQQAQGLLGVADTYLNDVADAVKAFDAAGTIPAKEVPSAGKAYAEYAQDQSKAKNNAAAVAAAKRAVQLTPSVGTYNLLGFVLIPAGDNTGAAAALEKARSLAAADPKSSARDRAVIDGNLASAYAGAGEIEKAKAVAAEAIKLDPSATVAQEAVAATYVNQAADKEKAGQQSEAAALYEQGAQAAPSLAVTLYSRAAFAYLNVKPNPDAAHAKASADKALALNPNSAQANFAAGVAVADQGNAKDALTYLNKADAAAKAANDSGLIAQIESAIKQLNGAK